MKLKLALSALVVFLLVGAFYYHGRVQYQKGVDATLAKNIADGIKANEDGRKEKTKNETKYKSMEANDLDSLGRSRGWVRQYEDR